MKSHPVVKRPELSGQTHPDISKAHVRNAANHESGAGRLEATVGFEPTRRGFADPRLNHLATSPLESGFHYNLRSDGMQHAGVCSIISDCGKLC